VGVTFRNFMKPFLHAFHLSLISFYLMSCSSISEKKAQLAEFPSEETEQINREALVIASERLAQMVSQVKGTPAATNYLASDLFLKGNMSLLEGDYASASMLFGHLVNLVPADEFIQKKYAVSLIRSGDLEKAQQVLEELYASSKEERVGLILAGVYTSTDHGEQARRTYQNILKANPGNEDACVFLSKSLAIDKHVNQAIKQLQQCSKAAPQNGMFDYYIGKIHMDQGQQEKAIAAFKSAQQRQPDLSLATNALGIIYEDKEQFEQAIKIYKSYLAKKPNDISVLTRIIQAMFINSSDNKPMGEEVLPYVEKLSDLEPDNLNIKVKLGILYTDVKRYPEALSVFKELLQVAPGSDKLLYYVGAIHQEMKHYPESIEYFNQIPSSSGLYNDSSLQMANMLSTLAQEEYFNDRNASYWQKNFLGHVDMRIAELKDMRVEFSVIKSGYYEGVSKYKEAMETMAQVRDEESFSIQHKYYLANLYEKENRFEESTNIIMGILEKEPKNAHAWNFLGYSLLERGEEMDKAYEYIKTALAISPDDGYIRDSLGWYYYKQGHTQKALKELEQAFKQVPHDVEILKHLATVHKELKDFSRARQLLEKALKHAKLQGDKQDIITAIEMLDGDRIPAASRGND
jgi:tetratricopeptide (TPR) repeat protein